MITVATFLLLSLFATLSAGGPVIARGLILDGEGRPVAGAEVRLERSLRDGVFPASSEDEVPAEVFRAVTGPDGHFAVAALPQPAFDLEIRAAGYAPLSRLGIRIPADRTAIELGSFRLRPGATAVGRVTDPRGRPIPGAAVWLQDSGAETPIAESGPDGRFVLRDLDPQASLALAICRRGFLTAYLPVAASAPEAARVVLEPAARIAGRVLGPDGSPVAGAEAYAYRVSEDLEGSGVLYGIDCLPGDHGLEMTDGQGRFSMESLLPGVFHLSVRAEGFSPDVLLADAGPSGPELTVRLQEGAVLAGRVLDTDGRPVSGAEVSTSGNAPVLSRPDGAYRLTGVAQGLAEVLYSHPDHETLSKILRTVPGDNHFDAKLPRLLRHRVSGRVLDPQGQPLAGASVLLQARRAAVTAADGSFTLRLAEGEHILESQGGSYAPARQAVRVAGPVEGLELRLSPGITLTGRLLAGREDLSGATVTATHSVSTLLWTTTVDSAGLYRLQGLFPGEWNVTGATKTRQQAEDLVLAPGEEERVFDLVLADAFEVRGRVTGPEGEPVVRAMVHLSGSEDGAIIPTQADGSFSIPLREGTYQSKAEGHAAGYAEAAGPPFEVRGPVEGIDIQLPKGITLRGRFHGVAPGELWGERVEAHSGSALRFARINGEGGYRIPGLSPGEWEVTAHRGLESATGRVRLEPGMDEAVLDLTFVPGSLTLAGRIVGAAELPSLSVILEKVSTGQSMGTRADEKGEFRLTDLPPGKYRLSIYGADRGAPYTAEIELSSNREVLVNLRRAAAEEP